MNAQEAKKELLRLEATLHAYGHAMGVMNVDMATAAPRHAAAGQSETLGVLGGIVHELMTSPRTREVLAAVLDAGDSLDPVTVRSAEVLREESDDMTRIPQDEYVAYQKLLVTSDAVWHEAKPKSDWAAFAPYLERIVAYNRRFAERKDPGRAPYDVLLDTYEKGASQASLDPFFALLRSELTPVILAVKERPAPDDAFLHASYPIAQQRVFTDRLMDLLGIDRADCAVAETEHPFTDGFNSHDVRITTHYYENDVTSSMYSVIHEGGHAIYELGIGDDLAGTVLAGGASMGIHESQSRFYENLIGRSRPFCEAVFPLMKELFPAQMKGADPEKLYRAVNKAQPSLIRTDADELTYPMHVMIRYEMEKAMIGGTLAIRDVPDAWNAMYGKYLGIRVPDHRRGVLQDSHWSGGAIGYFPSYALGSAYGVQMLEAMEKDLDVWTFVRRGELAPVTAWLRERVHCRGRLLKPADLLPEAIGERPDPSRYTAYLRQKFAALYDLKLG